MAGFERNTANQKLVVFAFDTTTGAAKTGDAANITVYIKELGGSVVALGDTSATELSPTNAPGYYEVDLANTELDTAYTYFFPKSATANTGVVAVMPAFTIPAGFSAGTGQVALATGGITNTTFAAGAINAAAIATGAIDDDALAADAVTAIQSGLSTFDATTDTVNLSSTSEGQIDTIETRVTTALPNSAPGALGGLPLYDDLFSVVAEGTLATVTSAGEMTLSGSFNDTDDFYNGMFLVPQDGPAAHQPRAISDYVGSSKTCTFTGTGAQLSRPFSVAPEVGDSVKILGLSGTA